MNDIESYVYTQVRNAVIASFLNADVSSEYVENPAKFPHICLEMTSSTNIAEFMTAEKREFATSQTYTANIFTNTSTAKSDAKAIAQVVDNAMQGLGFRRALYMRTPNIDRTIYRLTLRYEGIVSQAYDGQAGHFNITAG